MDPIPQSAAELALRRKEWLLELMERQRALSPWHRDIQRVRGIGADDFLDEFYAQSRPVLIEGGMEDWPALELWSPAYLRETVGSAPVSFMGGRASKPDFEIDKDGLWRTLPFDAYLELIESQPGNDAYVTATNSATNRETLAVLDRDVGTLPEFLAPGPGMMWIGPAGTLTPLHFDLTNNFIVQVVGRKRVVILPPSETPHLHHNLHVFSDVQDVTDDSRLALYPSARQARRYDIELKPGEMLYIPVGWWHQVAALDFSVTLTYISFLWSNDGHANFPANP